MSPVWIRTPPRLLRYVVEKGSIAVDGVSLTLVGADAEGFSVALIPHTRAVTTLGGKRDGDGARIEVSTPLAAELHAGDSVAVNGVCVTVVENGGGRLAFDILEETRARAKPFAHEVNLEVDVLAKYVEKLIAR